MTKKQQIQRVKSSQYEDLRQENEQLKAELAKMKIRLRAASVGTGAAVDDLVDQVYGLEQKNAELWGLLHQLTPDLAIYPDRYLLSYSDVELTGQDCIVDVRVAIRHEKQGFEVHPLASVFNGNVNQARDEILPRIFSAIWRGPMPENLRGPSIPGVDPKRIITAITDVAVYLHDGLQHLYHDNLDRVYRDQIQPYIDLQQISNDEARKCFRLAVEKTVENMRANRQMPTKPKGTPGAKRKNQPV